MNDVFADLAAERIARFHDERLADPGRPVSGAAHFEEGVWRSIEQNHRFNARLWDEEDLARRADAPDARIVASKRAMDRYEHGRDDSIEHIDEALVARIQYLTKPGARLNSETPGAMIDRLSILSLKIRAIRAQAGRTDAGPEHHRDCREKLEVLMEQREDLKRCLDELLVDCERGIAHFKVWRRFRIYGDPAPRPEAPAKSGA
jgi:hypothetical protein